MRDSDLAGLYGVETKYLNWQVKRNILRFPPHIRHAGVWRKTGEYSPD